MGKVNKRAKACDISQRVKKSVWERDQGLCVLCCRPGAPNAHFISRAHGGLGIEENVVTLCLRCHDTYDHGDRQTREYLKGRLRGYLAHIYPDWDETELIYRKARAVSP